MRALKIFPSSINRLECAVTCGEDGCVLSTADTIKLAACRAGGRYAQDHRRPLSSLNGRLC